MHLPMLMVVGTDTQLVKTIIEISLKRLPARCGD